MSAERKPSLLRVVLQDGGQFYDYVTGDLIANYGDTGELAIAEKYRAQFLAAHPDCRMATDEEAFGADEPEGAGSHG